MSGAATCSSNANATADGGFVIETWSLVKV
jgi:hypothetical protein